MSAQPARNPKPRESAHLSVSEHDCRLAEHHIQIPALGIAMLYNSLRGQIQHPAQRSIAGKRRLILSDSAKRPVPQFKGWPIRLFSVRSMCKKQTASRKEPFNTFEQGGRLRKFVNLLLYG